MKVRSTLIAMALFAMLSFPALADDADSDTTPVPMCTNTPVSAVIEAESKADASMICRAMGLLDGVRVKDIRTFSKAVVVLSRAGYEGSNSDIAKQLVEIVRLRGQYDKPDQWYPTLDTVVRSYQAFNGVVAPTDVIVFLHSAGPKAAKGLSNEGLETMLILIKEKKQQGD
jgi:hypothetical protein